MSSTSGTNPRESDSKCFVLFPIHPFLFVGIAIAYIVAALTLGLYFGDVSSSADQDYQILASIKSMDFKYVLVMEMTAAGIASIFCLIEERVNKRNIFSNRVSFMSRRKYRVSGPKYIL